MRFITPALTYSLPVALPGLLFACAAWFYAPDAPVLWSMLWIPSLDITLSLRLDGLSMVFTGLIGGIGFLIQLYALAYMRGKAGRGRFHALLTLFMLSMLGLVLADNILLLFVFWELTTLTSFLLIGFNHEQEGARKNALQALLVTGSGGLALLAGLILLGNAAESYELSTILAQGTTLSTKPEFTASLILILLGCLTKSAQFPFHFWLPNAMAAPTPVSAYLHSATMVKAGIYLLARLSPVYGDSALWSATLITTGTITAVWTILQALAQSDLKLMLAYSTTTVLGLLTLLLGLGSPAALTAMVTLLLAHAFYKAALFMVVGTIEKATGTREYTRLSGLRAALPLSFITTVLAALSSAGIPPFLGFIGKEYLYKATLPFAATVFPFILLTGILLVVLALVVTVRPFLSAPTPTDPAHKTVEEAPLLWLPAMVLALLGAVVPTMALSSLSDGIATPVRLAINSLYQPEAVHLWHGWTVELALSALTVLAGFGFYQVYPALFRLITWAMTRILSADTLYHALLKKMLQGAAWQTRLMQQQRLSRYGFLFFAALAGLLVAALSTMGRWPIMDFGMPAYYEIGLAILSVVAAGAAIMAPSRLYAIAALSVIGFCTTLIYVLYGAADVAMTQLLVETLVIVFILSSIRHLPLLDAVPSHSLARRSLHAVVSVLIGAGVGGVALHTLQLPLDMSLSQYFAATSLPEAHGRNIVNVILVDFRALDTFGEMSVVIFSAFSALAVLSYTPRKTVRR